MPHSTRLALTLDEEMLGKHGTPVASPWTADADLPLAKSLVTDLGDRFLIKYIRHNDRTRYSAPFSGITHYPGVHYLSPTPLCRDELISALNLPAPLPPPRHALILDPAQLTAHGPRKIRSGQGVEYVLLSGFPATAIVPPGWPVELR